MKYETRVVGSEMRPDPENSQGVGLEMVVFNVAVERSELVRLQAAYDAGSGTSPSVSDARPVLRNILDASIEAGV